MSRKANLNHYANLFLPLAHPSPSHARVCSSGGGYTFTRYCPAAICPYAICPALLPTTSPPSCVPVTHNAIPFVPPAAQLRVMRVGCTRAVQRAHKHTYDEDSDSTRPPPPQPTTNVGDEPTGHRPLTTSAEHWPRPTPHSPHDLAATANEFHDHTRQLLLHAQLAPRSRTMLRKTTRLT